jgi:rhamnose utilization protein RhaD (predicted bifunctional aldolase and dehydrogenase)
MEIAIAEEYETLCRRIGPWTDWIQGPGGNISVKDAAANRIIVKKSGALVSALNNGLVCDLAAIRQALAEGNEDVSHTVLEGTGKPSIEAFLHAFPPRIIVHVHPYPLMTALCNYGPIELPNTNTKMVEYYKPGVPLAQTMSLLYSDDTKVYFLRNHGVVIMGDTIDEILTQMTAIAKHLFRTPHTDIPLASALFDTMRNLTDNKMLIKPFFTSHILERIFLPYTPDIAVFLHEAPLLFEDPNDDHAAKLTAYYKKYGHLPSVIFANSVFYIVAGTNEACYNIYEILLSYLHVPLPANFLSEIQVSEIVNWDKEKLRQAANK